MNETGCSAQWVIRTGAIDSVLMNSVNKGVIVSGDKAKKETKGISYIIEEASWRQLSSVTGDAMIGCFNYNGKTALYVVNYDTANAQMVTLDFLSKSNMKVVQNAKTTYVSTNKLPLSMNAGEGILIVLE